MADIGEISVVVRAVLSQFDEGMARAASTTKATSDQMQAALDKTTASTAAASSAQAAAVERSTRRKTKAIETEAEAHARLSAMVERSVGVSQSAAGASDVLAESNARLAESAASASGAVSYQSRNIVQEGRDLEALDGIMAGTAKSAEDLAAQELVLDRLMRAGAISAEQQGAALAALSAREDELGLGADAATAGLERESVAARETAASTRSMANGMRYFEVAFAAYIGLDVARHFVDANIAIQRMYFTLEAATQSAAGATAQMKFLSQSADALGVNLRDAGQQYAQLLASASGAQGVSPANVRDLYLGLAKTFDVLHLSTDKQQRAMLALNEIMQQGVVHSRQLRRMLSNALPGVNPIHLVAQALHMTNQQLEKLLKTGQLTAAEVIPALAVGLNQWAERGGALKSSMEGTNATLNRFHNAMLALENNMANAFLPGLRAVIDQFTKIMQVLSPLQTSVHETQGRFSGLRSAVNGVTEFFMALDVIIKTMLLVAFALVRSDIDLMISGFKEISQVGVVVVKAFDLMFKVIKNFITQTGSAFSNLGTAIRDSFKGDFAGADASIKKMKESFKSAFTGGDLRAQLNQLTSAIAKIGKIGKMAAGDIHASWSTAIGMIKDQWNDLKSAMAKIGTVGPTLNKIPALSGKTVVPPLGGGGSGGGGGSIGSMPGESLLAVQIARARQAMQFRISMGQESNAQQLADERKFENEMYAAKRAELEKEKSLDGITLAQKKKISAELALLQEKHYKKMDLLSFQYAERMQKNWIKMFSVVTNAIDQSVKGMIRGTTTWHNAMRNLFQSVLGEFISMSIKQMTHWVATQITMTAATAAGTSTRTAIEEAANKKSLISAAATAVKKILMNMWVVMTEVYSAIASIPYVGPFLAPVLAIAAGATIASWAGRVASAEGGWGNVPSDQMAMIHKNEMVLPAHLAESIRSMTGSSTNSTNHFHIHAMDAGSFRDYLRENSAALAEGMLHAHRNGAFA